MTEHRQQQIGSSFSETFGRRVLLAANVILIAWSTFGLTIFGGLAIVALVTRGQEVSGERAVIALVGFVILGIIVSIPMTFVVVRFLKTRSLLTLLAFIVASLLVALALSPVPFIFTLKADIHHV